MAPKHPPKHPPKHLPKHPKTAEARAQEVACLKRQLDDVGLPAEIADRIVSAMDEFVVTGQGSSGTVKIPATNIAIQYVLSNQAHITSFIRVSRRSRPGR